MNKEFEITSVANNNAGQVVNTTPLPQDLHLEVEVQVMQNIN